MPSAGSLCPFSCLAAKPLSRSFGLFWIGFGPVVAAAAAALCPFSAARQAGAPGGRYRAGMGGIRTRGCWESF